MKRRNFFGLSVGVVLGLFGVKSVKAVSLVDKDNNQPRGKSVLADSESTIKWVDVTERLPELGYRRPFFESRRVLVACDSGRITIDYLWDESSKQDGSRLGWGNICNGQLHTVTHWAELPLHPAGIVCP